MNNFMLSICSTHCRDFINGNRLILQESAGFWKLRAIMTMDGVWAAWHTMTLRQGFPSAVCSHQAYLCQRQSQENITLYCKKYQCILLKRAASQAVIYSLIPRSTHPFAIKTPSSEEITGYNWTRVSMGSKYGFFSHLNIGVLCPCSWAVS